MSLLLTVFLIVFLTQLISWIGQKVLMEWVYLLYLRISGNSIAARQRALKAEILNNKSELLKTSAQDQFARWAKLRRSVDKGLADLEKLNSEVAAAKSSFSMKFNTVIWFLTTGVDLFVGWWYRRQAVFYLPQGWLGPLTWWLAFPFAPTGSVSVGIWSIACKRFLVLLNRIVKSCFSAAQPKQRAPTEGGSPAPTPFATPSRKATVESESEEEISS